jgi:hypothetical protein
MAIERIGATRSPVVCVDTVLVPGGRIGALGEEGADVGAWIVIDGIEIGAGGGALFGIPGEVSGSAGNSVWVAVDTSSFWKTGDEGTWSEGNAIFGVGGGLSGRSTVCTELEIIVQVAELILDGGLELNGTEARFRLWFASISAAVDAASFNFICTGDSIVCDEASIIAGRVGDGGGDGWMPVST